jgi:hypothetical protein
VISYARFFGLIRLTCMTVPSFFYWGWLTVDSPAPYASPPKASWILIAALAGSAVLGLLMEWQLRRTLAEIFRHAPGSSSS